MAGVWTYETLLGQDLGLGTSTGSRTAPNGGTLNGHQISLTTFSTQGPDGQCESTTWAPGVIAAGSQATTTLTVSGAALGDLTLGSFSLSLQGCLFSLYVSAANTVTAVIYNGTGSSVTIGSGTLKALVFAVR